MITHSEDEVVALHYYESVVYFIVFQQENWIMHALHDIDDHNVSFSIQDSWAVNHTSLSVNLNLSDKD